MNGGNILFSYFALNSSVNKKSINEKKNFTVQFNI